jgi:two-component system LytT family response regulator
MLCETIKQLASTLDPTKFVRIRRSVIVNVDRVSEIRREGRSEGSVVVVGGQRLRMSRAGWQSLLAVSCKYGTYFPTLYCPPAFMMHKTRRLSIMMCDSL